MSLYPAPIPTGHVRDAPARATLNRLRPLHRITALLVGVTLSPGCADSSRHSPEHERAVLLPATDTVGSDYFTFAQRQRAFLHAVSTTSIDELGTLVRMDFMIHDAAPADSLRRQVPTAPFPAPWVPRSTFSADYVRFMQEGLGLRFSEAATYRVMRRGARATVVTVPPEGTPYLTNWDSSSIGWRVTSIMINIPSERLALVEKQFRERYSTSTPR